MINSNKPLFHKNFKYIYIEKGILEHANTKKILSHFPNATCIEINHYKDIFCRSRQNILLQKQALSLILARKDTHFLYPGANVCQNFGNDNFYYTSCIMNCLYHCEYCYLQGMYASGNVVIFVNLEDLFNEVTCILKKKRIYLCISYDTDLLAFEPLTGYVSKWLQFAEHNPNLTIEIRTKSANNSFLLDTNPLSNVFFAWTLSPQEIAERYEHHAPSTVARIQAARKVLDAGWKVRLCFDPILYQKNWEALYHSMIQNTFQFLDPDKITDVSLGIFRVSKDYLKRMRKQNPDSSILYYPYILNEGIYEYSKDLTHKMVTTIQQYLQTYIAPDKIFSWEDKNDGGNRE